MAHEVTCPRCGCSVALANLHGLVDDEVRVGSHPNAVSVARASLERRGQRFADAPDVGVLVHDVDGAACREVRCRVCFERPVAA